MENNEYGTGRKNWMEIFEPSETDGTLRSNNSVFTPPANVKGRNFRGATTRYGYGPVNAPKVTSGGGFTDYANDPVSTGPSAGSGAMGYSGAMGDGGGAMGDGGGGGGMGESVNVKFVAFLESLKGEDTAEFIDVVKAGFIAINNVK